MDGTDCCCKDVRLRSSAPAAVFGLVILYLYRSLGLMNRQLFITVAGLLAAIGPANVPAESANGHHLSLMADIPIVEVAPRQAGRSFVQLPTLQYSFQLEARCADDTLPESFALNVADTRITLDAADLDGQATVTGRQLKLEIPANQLAPIAINAFCELPPAVPGPGNDADHHADIHNSELPVPGALSAHASLLCVSESRRAMTYTASSLDLLLVCREPDREQQVPDVRFR